MKQIINSCNIYTDWPNIEIDYKRKIRFFIDNFQGYIPNEDSFKIIHLREPEAICKMRTEIIKNKDKFDAIITFDDEILKNCKNSYFLPFGTSWINDYNFPEKKFQISSITGHKESTDGHILRKKFITSKQKLTIK